MEKIRIMASPAYTVYVGEGFIRHAGICLQDVSASEKVMLLCDETVYELYGKQMIASLRSEKFNTCAFIVKPGENAKSPSNLLALWNSLAENGFTPNDTLLTLGGGVVSDLGGFAAATYMHGLRHVIFSTTLLSMCDACVGGKASIHLKAGKNMAGVYGVPTAVFCDTDALAALPKSAYGDGMAEIIKYGMIGSEDLLVSLYGHPTQQEMIVKAINIKKDFMETNTFLYKKKELPDLGGTLAEAAQKLSGGRLSYGCAVAAGMFLTTQASVRNGVCTPATLDFLGKILDKYELPKSFPFTVRELCAAITLKKPEESTVSLVLPEGIGKAIRKNLPADSLYDFFAK